MVLLLYGAVILLTVFLDLFTKHLVKTSEFLLGGGTKELIPHILRLRYVENPGAAFGSLADSRWVFIVFSTLAILVLSVLLIRKRKSMSRWVGVAFSLVVGGGIGNMYERLFNVNANGRQVVTDFLDFYLFSFWKWVFNVADAAVCVGAAILIVYFLRDAWKEYRKEKREKAADGGTETLSEAETAATEEMTGENDELVLMDELDPDGDMTDELACLDPEEELSDPSVPTPPVSDEPGEGELRDENGQVGTAAKPESDQKGSL